MKHFQKKLILKLRENNLLENITNQDKILEEKLREEKINQQDKKKFYSTGIVM